MPEIDTTNKFLIAASVGKGQDEIIFLTPVPQRLSRADAILLAAWIVAMADDDRDESTDFEKVLTAVNNT